MVVRVFFALPDLREFSLGKPQGLRARDDPQLPKEKVDRVVPDPRCGLREGEGGSDVLYVPKFARAWFREATRMACQG